MRSQFVLSEIGIGLRRNFTLTVAVVLTVAISLSMLGVSLLVNRQVTVTKELYTGNVEVSVYLCQAKSTARSCGGTAIGEEQRQQLLGELQGLPQVQRVEYESKQQAYQRFQEQFKDDPDLLANVREEALPEAFRVKLRKGDQFEVVASAVRDRPGVEAVVDNAELFKPLFSVLNRVQQLALYAAVVALLAAVLLISNTIRVAAFSRRRETGIMRLVGASNLYIQLPFLLEGVLAGMVGAGLASGVLVLLKKTIIDGELKAALPLINWVGWDEVLVVVPVLFGVGIVLAAIASFLTLRRHLRV